MTPPVIRYARADDGASVAYQVLGDGPDLVCVPGFFSHVDFAWELPASARFLHRLASFSRLIVMDKRGRGGVDGLVLYAAGPGEIVVSSTVRELVEGSAITFEHLGAFELKGVRGDRDLFTARLDEGPRSVTIP